MIVVGLQDGAFLLPDDVAVAARERRVRTSIDPGWRPLLSGEVADLFGVLPRPVVPLDDEAQVAAVRQPRDGDGDGFVYDDTPRQRPAPVRLPKLPVANRVKARPKQTPTATGDDWESGVTDRQALKVAQTMNRPGQVKRTGAVLHVAVPSRASGRTRMSSTGNRIEVRADEELLDLLKPHLDGVKAYQYDETSQPIELGNVSTELAYLPRTSVGLAAKAAQDEDSSRDWRTTWASFPLLHEAMTVTQQSLRDAGYTHVVLFRGVPLATNADKAFNDASSQSLPIGVLPSNDTGITSWSTNPFMARGYAPEDGGALIAALVPVEQIVSFDMIGLQSATQEAGFGMGWRTREQVRDAIADGKNPKLTVKATGREVLAAESVEQAQRMLDQSAPLTLSANRMAVGGSGDADSAYVDYRMAHQPNYGPGAYDLSDGDMLPDDVYDHPERYATGTRGNPQWLDETVSQLTAARGNREALVTVYRSVPPDVAARGDAAWDEGNWISLSKGYADRHGTSNGGPDWVTMSRQVPAWQVRFAGDDLMEWGWFPKGDPGGEWVSEWGGTPEPVDTASAVESPMSVDLVETVEAQGGFTFDPRTGDFPTSGIAVGVSGFSAIIKHDEWVKPGVAKQAIADYLRKMRDDGVADKVFIGGWWDKEHDEVVLDRVDVFADRDEGIRAGSERGEQAVFDLGAGEEIDTGGTGGRENYEIVGAETEPASGLSSGQGVSRPDGSGNRRDSGDAGSPDEETDGRLSVDAFADTLRSRYPDVTALELREIQSGDGPYLEFDRLTVGTSRQGIGTALMGDLIAYADARNLPIFLTPEPTGPRSERMPKAQLQRWYSRFGFRRNRSDFRSRQTMVREPEAAEERPAEQASGRTDSFTASRRSDGVESRYAFGDHEWSVIDEDVADNQYAAYSDWSYPQGNWRIRHGAAALMGIDPPPSMGEEAIDANVRAWLSTGQKPDDVTDWQTEEVQSGIQFGNAVLTAISGDSEPSTREMFRGMAVPEGSVFLTAQAGDNLTLPPSAFSLSRDLAESFSDPVPGSGERPVVLRLRPGALSMSSPMEEGYSESIQLDGEWVEVPVEDITDGSFQVIDRSVDAEGRTVLELQHIAVFDPFSNAMRPVPASTLRANQMKADGASPDALDAIIQEGSLADRAERSEDARIALAESLTPAQGRSLTAELVEPYRVQPWLTLPKDVAALQVPNGYEGATTTYLVYTNQMSFTLTVPAGSKVPASGIDGGQVPPVRYELEAIAGEGVGKTSAPLARRAAVQAFDAGWTADVQGVLGRAPSALMRAVQRLKLSTGGERSDEVMRSLKAQALEPDEALDAVADALAQSIYDRTQAFLSERNIRTVRVYRGMALPVDHPAWSQSDGQAVVEQLPLSSWSTDRAVADRFGYDGDYATSAVRKALLIRDVPAAEVFGIDATGLGSDWEREVVLLSAADAVTTLTGAPAAVTASVGNLPVVVVDDTADNAMWVRAARLAKTAAPRLRRPSTPVGIPSGDSTYLRSKGLWNDPGSGRFAPRGFSTLKALAMEFVAGEQVRDAAKTAGKVKARVADNRMSRAGISKGDVVEVVYKDDDYGKVQVVGKSGKPRWYDVQWARFDEVVTGDDPEPKPDVTPEPKPVKPEPKPPKRKTPKQARKAALALLEDVPSDAFAPEPIEKYIRSQLGTTQIANDVQIQDRVMATLRRQGAISIDDSDVAVWKREVATMPGMGDTPSGIKLGSLEAATVGAIVDHNKALFNKGGYVRIDATVDDVKFDRVDTLEAINTQIVDKWLASVEDKQQTPQDRDAFIRATNLWGPDGRPDGNVVVTPDQLSPWGQTLLLLSQIATPPNWRADPGRAVFTNDERQARLAWLYDDFAPATFVTSDQEQRAAGTDPPSVSSDVVEQVLDSVDVDGLGYALESWVNRSDRDVSSGLTDRRAFADIVDYPVTDRLKTKGRERLEERGFPSTEAALEAERATNVIFGRTAVDGRLRMDEDAEIGLGVGPNLGLFTTLPSADGSFTEADLTPLGKIMYRALAGIATDQRMRGSVSSTSNTELTATDKQRLNAVVAAGRVLLDDLRRVEADGSTIGDAPDEASAQAAYDKARDAAVQARSDFERDVLPKVVKSVLKSARFWTSETRQVFAEITASDDYTVELDDLGLGFRLTYPDGAFVTIKSVSGQRGASEGKFVGYVVDDVTPANGESFAPSWTESRWRAPKAVSESGREVMRLGEVRGKAFNELGYAQAAAKYGSLEEAKRVEGGAIRDSFVPEMLRMLSRAKVGGGQYGTFDTADGETFRVTPHGRNDVGGFAELLEVQGLDIDDVIAQLSEASLTTDQYANDFSYSVRLRRPDGTETPMTLTAQINTSSWKEPFVLTVQRESGSPLGDLGNIAFVVSADQSTREVTDSERDKATRDSALYERAALLQMYLKRIAGRQSNAKERLPKVRQAWAAEALDAGEPTPLRYTARGPRKQLVADAGRFIPKRLIERVGQVSVKSGSRGRSYYAPWDKEITMKDDSPSTALHELGHHLEKDPALNRALWAFYVKRTGGASTQPVKMQKLLKGYGYRKDEVSRPDEFFVPYAGKAYDGNESREGVSSYEMFTMGLQGVFYGHRGEKGAVIDDEYASFILGALLLSSRGDDERSVSDGADVDAVVPTGGEA